MPLAFIQPSAPTIGREPPTGPAWTHEIKWDGWRCQIIKDEKGVRIYSRTKIDWSHRLPNIVDAIRELPAQSFILDGELVGNEGDFYGIAAAMRRRQVTVVAFDLMHLDGVDLRRLSLDERKKALAKLFKKARKPIVLSEVFEDGAALLQSANEYGLEGIVSKLRDQSYVSRNNRGWIKVKTPRWRADNADRGERFGKKA